MRSQTNNPTRHDAGGVSALSPARPPSQPPQFPAATSVVERGETTHQPKVSAQAGREESARPSRAPMPEPDRTYSLPLPRRKNTPLAFNTDC